MLNSVKIKKINMCSCGYEADFIIKAFGMKLHAYAQIDKDFASTIPINQNLELDLWLICCFVKNSNRKCKFIEENDNSIKVIGEVEKIIDECSLRVRSNYVIDIDNEENIPESIKEGMLVEATGSIRIYFPGTEYSF